MAKTGQASDALDRANALLTAIAQASRDPRVNDFRFLAAFYKARDETRKYIKGFHSHQDGKECLEKEGVEKTWYLIFDLGNSDAIYVMSDGVTEADTQPKDTDIEFDQSLLNKRLGDTYPVQVTEYEKDDPNDSEQENTVNPEQTTT